jgi:hypothetical protein
MPPIIIAFSPLLYFLCFVWLLSLTFLFLFGAAVPATQLDMAVVSATEGRERQGRSAVYTFSFCSVPPWWMKYERGRRGGGRGRQS